MNGNQKKILSLFSVLLLVLSLVPLASAANVAVWNEWMIGGEGIGDYQLTVNEGSNVQFYVFVDAFSNFDLDVGLYNSNNQLVYTFDSVNNYNSFYDEYFYTANTVGTFYVRSVATSGSSISKDELKLVVSCVDTDDDGVCNTDEVPGCTDSDAENYNPLATDNDDSCMYGSNHAPNFGLSPKADKATWFFLLPLFPTYVLEEGNSLAVNVIGTDEDNDQLSFEFEGVFGDLPDWMHFYDNGDNTATIALVSSEVGSYSAKITVIDEHGSSFYWPVLFEVAEKSADVLGCTDSDALNYNARATVDDDSCVYAPNNQPPLLNINGPNVVYEGEELIVIVDVDDENHGAASVKAYREECIIGNRLFCYNTDLPAGAEFNFVSRESGVLTWTPDYTFVTHPDQNEEITFVFVVDDGEFDTEEEITISVIDVNQIPELDVQTNEPFGENQEVRVVAVGSDADEEDELSYEVNNVPDWLSVDIGGDTVSISGIPPCSAAGVYEIGIRVTDGIDVLNEVITLNVAETCNVEVLGCTDSDALNYNPLANVDDGSCDAIVSGCTDVSAFNYNPLANVDDGSCDAILAGCTDSEAANYDPNANADDGSCVCVDLDNDGICDNEDPCVDQDNDGFCDNKDACPLVAEDFDNYLDEDGCPESHNDANIASVHFNSETVIPGDYLSMYIRMGNSGDTSFSDMRAEAIVYEWGEKAATGEFNLQPGQEKGKHLVMQVPYHAQPGDYLIKVTMKNDYYHESTYRLVTIY